MGGKQASALQNRTALAQLPRAVIKENALQNNYFRAPVDLSWACEQLVVSSSRCGLKFSFRRV